MNTLSDIKPVSFLKSHAADILKQINDTHRPIVITQNGEPRGVLQDPESYDNMRKSIGLLKLISQGEEDIKQGNTKTQDQVFKDIDKILTKKGK
ncbi:MAG: type II toxin-antitoxin system Phd/YefM family antitoxin [Desulfobulbaceae bacterium]|nr:type II toxin-antitoxin system Phd/YefM family antitoxin [Desulfobulbaceae bacterium]